MCVLLQFTGKGNAQELRRTVEVVKFHSFTGALGMLTFPPSLPCFYFSSPFLLPLPTDLHTSSIPNSGRQRT